MFDERQIAPLVIAGPENVEPMRATALAVDEEGEEEEEEEEDEVRGGHNGAQRATMYPFGSKDRRRHPGIGTPLIFFLVFGCLLIIAVASPLHPVPPHRGESRSIPASAFHRTLCLFIGSIC